MLTTDAFDESLMLTKHEKAIKKYPAPSWGDHVLHGRRERTRAAYVLSPERTLAELDRIGRLVQVPRPRRRRSVKSR